MKILNLDAYTSAKRKVKWKGVQHDVVQISVQEFVDALKATEDAEKAQVATKTKGRKAEDQIRLSAAIEKMIESVQKGIPTFPKEDLGTMPPEALKALIDFIRGELDGEAEVSDADAAEAGEGDEPKKP